MGFCFFNNVAITARWLLKRRSLSRILILDWDVHHGNGTQEMFYASPEVLYMSTHQSPFYPGTGHLNEIGEGAGPGYTVNVPMPATFGDSEYLRVFDDLMMPIARQFKPEFVLISAGFRLPLSRSARCNAGDRERLRRDDAADQAAAADCCGGKIVAVLEGGYDLKALAASGQAVIEELGRDGDEPAALQEGPNRVIPIIQRARYFHQEHWPFA